MTKELYDTIHYLVHEEGMADWIYHVRDSARENRAPEDEHTNSWDLPRVKKYAAAVQFLDKWLRENKPKGLYGEDLDD